MNIGLILDFKMPSATTAYVASIPRVSELLPIEKPFFTRMMNIGHWKDLVLNLWRLKDLERCVSSSLMATMTSIH